MTTTTAPAATDARSLPLQAFAEVAIVASTLVSVVALRRLFLDSDWLLPLLVQAVAAHALCIVLRRLSVPGFVAIVLVPLAAFAWLGVVHAPDTTTLAVPSFATYDALTTQVSDAWAVFDDVRAPTAPLEGFLIVCGWAIWMIALLADWAAFRVEATLEALLPSAALLVLVAVLGSDEYRAVTMAGWLLAVLAFVVIRRAERVGQRSTWIGDRRRHGPRTLVQLGGALAAVAVLTSAVLGPRLPGADDEAIVSLRDIGDDDTSTRVTISPLVDIRSRIVNQANVEVFTVRSTTRSYWRLTSLNQFDGRIWRSSGSFGSASGDLPDGVPVQSEQFVSDQEFQISALSQIWLPAAFEPKEIAIEANVRYDEVSGTLIVDDDRPTSDQLVYAVRSALPVHDPGALAAASALIPSDIADDYLPLPEDFSPEVRALAQQVTASGTNRYEQAILLQSFFRDEFTYDLNVGAGHGENAIERFVFESRTGYCEQFAGSFAAMARSLGMPARVAVGFTPGTADVADPTLYRVRGEHAHAWPEVYLGQYGWVAFEPTPGRGAPFAEQYTGVPEQQAAAGDPFTATTTPSPQTTAVPDDATAPSTAPPLTMPAEPGADRGASDSPGLSPLETGSPWPGRIFVVLVVVLTAGVAYLAVLAAVVVLRHRRRRAAATTPGAQVALAWEESLAAIRRAGVPVSRADTHTEVVGRVDERLPEVTEPVERLAAAAEVATYGADAPVSEVGTTALALADDIARRARRVQAPVDRFRADVHPRRLLDQ